MVAFLEKKTKMPYMKRFLYSFLTIFFLALVFEACSGRFVKREQLNELEQDYQGIYEIVADIDVGNNDYEPLPVGSQVRLYFRSGGESVKVYAYPHTQRREEALGKNILYMFEGDFPEEEYDRKLFEEKLNTIVRKISDE